MSVDKMNPVPSLKSDRSRIGAPRRLPTSGPSDTVAFTTERLSALPLHQKPTPGLVAPVWSMGHPLECAPSKAIWGRGKWELHIFATVCNLLDVPISVFDIHTNLYKATGFVQQLLMVIHRARIELTQDNSILSEGKIWALEPNSVQPFELVLDVSLYDTLMTTLIFGVFVDYRRVTKASTRNERLASDKIYVFQHFHEWRTTKCHFVSRDNEFLRRRVLQSPDDAGVQKAYTELENILNQHHRVDSTLTSLEPRPATFGLVNWSKEFSLAENIRSDLLTALPDTLNYIHKRLPVAFDLLKLCTFFSSTEIPNELMLEGFYQVGHQLYDELYREMKSGGLFNPRRLLDPRKWFRRSAYWRIKSLEDGVKHYVECMRLLCEHRILEWHSPQQAFGFGSNACAEVLAGMDVQAKTIWAKKAIECLTAIIPDMTEVDRDDALAKRLLSHAMRCLEELDNLDLSGPDSALLLYYSVAVAVKIVSPALSWLLQYGTGVAQKVNTNDPEAGFVWLIIGESQRIAGRVEEAQSLLQQARDILFVREGAAGVQYQTCLQNLGALYRDTGRFKEAELLFAESLASLSSSLGPDDPQLVHLLEDYAQLLRITGRGLEAQPLLKRANAIRENTWNAGLSID